MKKIIPVFVLMLAAGAAWFIFHREPFLYAGTVEATEVDLSARLAAPILDIGSKEGDVVRAGQVLVRLDGEDLRLAADQAERDYRRGVTLNKQGSLPQESLERLRYKRDDAALRLSWATLTSPLNGTTLRRYREPGEWVTPGQKILTLADLGDLYAYIYVPAPVMGRLSLGQSVSGVLPDLGNRSVTGKIIHIRSGAEFTPKNVQTRTERERLVFGIKVAWDNKDGALKPGMNVEVQLPSEGR